jgi:CheY-like chemotaxis protein/anti-sigma regulatory factor (Ser/Thr protein kinase)
MTAHEVRHRATVVKVLEPVPLVVGDRGRLVQVFVNLLVNAAHAIPPGHADEYEIVVSTRVRDGMVEAEVADSGTGIPRESVDRIFEPFYTTKPVGEGTGLGLAICHGIVTSYGGEILVSSTPGRGSVFTVRLQRAERDSCDAPPSRPSLGGLPPGVRVLVVDDDPGVRQLLGRLLGEQRLVFAASGREALERCRVERFDLLVCDLMMAELTGKELYEALEREDPESARRTVFVSGGASTEDLSRFAALHASRVVAKPFEASTLTDVLSAVLAERGPRPEGGSSKPPSKVA